MSPRKAKTKTMDTSKMVKRLLIASLTTMVLLASFVWAQTVWAADDAVKVNEDPQVQSEAADFIQLLADKALTTLKQKDNTIADQEVRFQEILDEGFNVKYIGRISLGRHKSKASAKDLNQYYALFPKYLVKVYTSRLTKLDTREVKVGQVFPNGKRDMYVRTKVIDGEQKSYDVDWRVRPLKKTEADDQATAPAYSIVDVKIEGISMARTQRDDFASRISESGMSGLLTFMQNIIAGEISVAEDTAQSDMKQAN